MAIANSAAAQPAPPAPPPAGAAPAPVPEAARVNFEAGVALLQDPAKPRYEEAYARFRAAYAVHPSPKILGNIALCAMKLERDMEAIEAYDKYLKESPDLSSDERAQVERDLFTLRTGLTRIVVWSTPDGATIVDSRIATTGENVTNTYGPLRGSLELGLRSGHHVLRARAPGRPEVVHEFDAKGGTLPGKHFEIPEAARAQVVVREAPRDRPVPTSVFIGAGVTGVLAIGTAVTGLVALKNASDYDNANRGPTPERAEDLRDRTERLNLVSDLFLVGAVVAAGVTTFLFLTRPEATRKTGLTSPQTPGPRPFGLAF